VIFFFFYFFIALFRPFNIISLLPVNGEISCVVAGEIFCEISGAVAGEVAGEKMSDVASAVAEKRPRLTARQPDAHPETQPRPTFRERRVAVRRLLITPP